ncbi:consortin [Microcaecilia unicolor]|uniref:Consortin n=1 Tax=Microcaecilia unicolor TaxID=1415580 RepID=A0A6P7XGL5_9AMPH|nr:consortin [Microcaecilia unicolor]
MDDRDVQPNEIQVEAEERPDAVGNIESTSSPVASTSDENENHLDGKKSEPSTDSGCVTGTPVTLSEDSINNNERCNSQGGPPGSRSISEEPEDSKKLESVSSSNQGDCKPVQTKDKRSPGKKSGSKSKKGTKVKSTGVTSTGTTVFTQESMSADPMQEENACEANLDSQPRDQKKHLQSLLSLIGEEIEKADARILPHCLHQMAEAYFQEEEYEKAIQFIHLEQLYHEHLLANLSAIQEKWETKWKTVMPDKMSSPRNSDKGLNVEELERLEHLCTSHREPAVRKRKLMSAEKSWRCKEFTALMESEELRECAAASCNSNGDTHPGTEPGPAKQHAKEKTIVSLPWDGKPDSLTEAASLRVASGKAHMEEQHHKAESTFEGDTQSTESVGRPYSVCLCSGDARKDNCIQLEEIQLGEDVAQITEISIELKEELSKEPTVERLRGADHTVPDRKASKGVSQAEGNSFKTKHCDDSAEILESQLGNIVSGLQPLGLEDEERESLQGRTDSSTCNLAPDENTIKTALSSYTSRDETDEEMQNEMTEDLYIPLLNGSIKDSRGRLTNLEQQDDFDTLIDDDTSYSPGESAQEDSFASLDELAKRIEVEEIVPAEGLVSILKKRKDNEGKNVVEIQQKAAKRRVRFQEVDDALDQDELAGGSCLLLVLLCLVTVFISVGGTALYCSFVDMESPVCSEFASNMDLYYTQVLQVIEELKHWVYPPS